jgi:ketosteroid isomerase-like protein
VSARGDAEGVLLASDALSIAFERRDLTAALECFADDDELAYVGSEQGEKAIGRPAIVALLGDLFTRPEAYSWRLTDPVVWTRGDVAGLCSEAVGRAQNAKGTEEFAYRLTGSLERIDRMWRWRICQGSEPTSTGRSFGIEGSGTRP